VGVGEAGAPAGAESCGIGDIRSEEVFGQGVGGDQREESIEGSGRLTVAQGRRSEIRDGISSLLIVSKRTQVNKSHLSAALLWRKESQEGKSGKGGKGN